MTNKLLPKLEIGARFGMLEVKRVSSINKAGNEVYEVQCVCGKKLELTFASLVNQRRKSCGCNKNNVKSAYGKEMQRQKEDSIKLAQSLKRYCKQRKMTVHERFQADEQWLLAQLRRWRKREQIIEAL